MARSRLAIGGLALVLAGCSGEDVRDELEVGGRVIKLAEPADLSEGVDHIPYQNCDKFDDGEWTYGLEVLEQGGDDVLVISTDCIMDRGVYQGNSRMTLAQAQKSYGDELVFRMRDHVATFNATARRGQEVRATTSEDLEQGFSRTIEAKCETLDNGTVPLGYRVQLAGEHQVMSWSLDCGVSQSGEVTGNFGTQKNMLDAFNRYVADKVEADLARLNATRIHR
jgi:hypothetical protein